MSSWASPYDPLFRPLIKLHRENPNRIFVKDYATNEEISVGRFLDHICYIRDQVLEFLPGKLKKTLQKSWWQQSDFHTHICAFVNTQYETVVTFMALYSIGVTFIPINAKTPPEEVEPYLKKHGVCAVIGHRNAITNINDNILWFSSTIPTYDIKEIRPHTKFGLVRGSPMSDEKGCILISTSGTTGPLKGALHTRRSVHAAADTMQSTFNFTSADTALIARTLMWGYGFSVFLGCLKGNTRVELCESIYGAEFFWKRMREGGVTVFNSIPIDLVALQRYYEGLENAEKSACREGIKGLRVLTSSGGYTSEDLLRFWREVRNGTPLLKMYGSSEAFMIACSWTEYEKDLPVFCVGRLCTGVQINLADGEEGELGIKSESLFTRYLKFVDDDGTKPLDEHGYFQTGDIAKRKGDRLFILGRIATDVIQREGHKFYSPAIENALLSLPNITEALVLGVPEDKIGTERVAALVRIEKSTTSLAVPSVLQSLWLQLLERGIERYKWPTALRMLGPGEAIPMSERGKIKKVDAREMFFGVSVVDMRGSGRWEVR